MKNRTRIAPTPSGLLHPGNAWSFLLTWLLARSRGGSVNLRIDDLDTARFRDEYLEDIFASLEWLGLDWDTGPRSPADFKSSYSQHLRMDRYRAALQALSGVSDADGPLLYACCCSREKVRRDSLAAGRPGIYSGTCRHAGHPMQLSGRDEDGATALETYPLRLRVPRNAEVSLEKVLTLPPGPLNLAPGQDMGDFVIWQRNGDPAYQLASLVDDEERGIDLIVRGKDLLPSTGVQAWLAGRLGYVNFPRAAFLHHDLILDPQGGKLSKSEGADSLRALRESSGTPKPLMRWFARRLGVDPETVETPTDLLPGFVPERIPMQPASWSDFAREA
ncbi:MAG: glutamate--tRNA ligase family protein [Fibrobacteria bacterium]